MLFNFKNVFTLVGKVNTAARQKDLCDLCMLKSPSASASLIYLKPNCTAMNLHYFNIYRMFLC